MAHVIRRDRPRNRRAVVLLASVAAVASLLATSGPSVADVAALRGSAYGYFASVSLFGGPPNVRGPVPTVTLAPDASNSPQTANVETGLVQVGPAILFSTGPIEVSTAGTAGPAGSVTSTATITGINTSGVEVFTAASASSNCTATEAGVTGSTTIIDGRVRTSEGNPEVGGDEKYVTVPTEPAPNTTVNGTIEGVGDSFRYIFNEQITNPDGSLSVYAGHLQLLGPTAVGDLYWGKVECGVTDATTPTTLATTTSSTSTTSTTMTSTSTTSTSTTSTSTTSTSTSTTLPPTTTTTRPPPDLSIVKTCDPGPVAPDVFVNCSVTVSNAGPSPAQNVVVVDDLPPGMRIVGRGSGGGFFCPAPLPPADPFTCRLTTLAADASATFTFLVRTSDDLTPGSTLVNTATVASTPPDAGPGPNTATSTTAVVACGIAGAGDIAGTPGNDVICGSAGADRIAGLGGNDVIFGMGGDDLITGGDGNDTILGGDGSDQLVGGNGNDRLFAGAGAVDRLLGGPGDDGIYLGDSAGGDFGVGGDHVTGDACSADPGDSVAQCEG